MKDEHSYRALAAHFKVDVAAVKRWPWLKDRTETIEQIEARKKRYEEENATGKNAPENLNAVRVQKLKREVERLDLKIKRERGELVSKTDIQEACIRIVSVWCSELDALVSDLPGQIGGLSETEMSPKLRSRIELLKRNAKNAFKDL
jgi:hypothetical protein